MPKTDLNREVVGHQQALLPLNRALDRGQPNHAYLLLGPPGVGKTTLARAMARALNCLGEERPCGQCRPCRLAERGAFADFQLVGRGEGEAAPRGKAAAQRESSRSISIEQIRALQHDASLAPYEGRWKVYVVADAQGLTIPAANSLLKTLEEPPPQVVLILTAEDGDGLLPTIVSRCQVIRLSPLPVAEIESALRERWQAPPEDARLLARLSGGRIGWSVRALREPGILEERSTRISDLLDLLRGSRAARFDYAEKLSQDYGRDPDRVLGVLDLWLGWWRDVLLTRVGCDELVENWDRLEELKGRARSLTVAQARGALRSIESALADLGRNVNPRLTLEVLLLGLP